MKVFLKAYLASLLAGLTFVFLLFLSLLLMPKEEKIAVQKNSILHLELNKPIVDRTIENPFSEFNFAGFSGEGQIGLNDITKALNFAKDDERIKGVMIDFGVFSAGISTLKEIRNALIEFQESGKFVWSYGDVYSQGGYYLASVSDSVFFNPSGYMDWAGLASTQPFLKEMFDKIGIEPVVVRGSNNKFKSAVEPLIETEMSEANREQLETILNDLWSEVLMEVAESRNMTTDSLQAIANGLKSLMPSGALDNGLVDKLDHRSDVEDRLKKITGTKRKRKLATISPERYVKSFGYDMKDNRVAVIYAQGDITMGDGGPESITPVPFVKAVKKAAESEKVKAIVLRINSGGGSALASDVIYNELLKAKGDKPLVVSMGDVAASGGYFLACPADKIVAQPTTITGSIGVFMMFFTMQGLLEEKMGVHMSTVKTGEMADMGNPVRPLSEAEYTVLQKSVDETYGQFIHRIKEGRNLDSLYIDSIGQGRIWSGIRAQELGLVDELGGLDKAISIAAELAEIEDYSLYELPKFKNSLERILESLGQASMKERLLKDELGEHYELYQQIKDIRSQEGMLAKMPVDIVIK